MPLDSHNKDRTYIQQHIHFYLTEKIEVIVEESYEDGHVTHDENHYAKYVDDVLRIEVFFVFV